VLRTMYFSYSRTVRARACVLSARVCVHSLIFERIMSKFAGNILRLTICGKDYVLFIVTHRVYACKRASASACVITHSLIYGRIHFKFAVNILQITTSSMGYVIFMITHRAHVCVRALGKKAFAHPWTDSLQICWAHTTDDHKLHGLHTYLHAPRAQCASARMINCFANDGFSSNWG
jgi:hypothetical protein